MGRKGYNCMDCGEWVDRYLHKRRKPVCSECGIKRAAAHNRAMAAGTAPLMERERQHGQELARQIAAREGPLYEAWRDGIKRAAQYL